MAVQFLTGTCAALNVTLESEGNNILLQVFGILFSWMLVLPNVGRWMLPDADAGRRRLTRGGERLVSL